MPRDKALHKTLMTRIRNRWTELRAVKDTKHKNARKYTDDKIWAMMCDEFLLTQRRLQDIVYMKDEKRDDNKQGELF